MVAAPHSRRLTPHCCCPRSSSGVSLPDEGCRHRPASRANIPNQPAPPSPAIAAPTTSSRPSRAVQQAQRCFHPRGPVPPRSTAPPPSPSTGAPSQSSVAPSTSSSPPRHPATAGTPHRPARPRLPDLALHPRLAPPNHPKRLCKIRKVQLYDSQV